MVAGAAAPTTAAAPAKAARCDPRDPAGAAAGCGTRLCRSSSMEASGPADRLNSGEGDRGFECQQREPSTPSNPISRVSARFCPMPATITPLRVAHYPDYAAVPVEHRFASFKLRASLRVLGVVGKGGGGVGGGGGGGGGELVGRGGGGSQHQMSRRAPHSHYDATQHHARRSQQCATHASRQPDLFASTATISRSAAATGFHWSPHARARRPCRR